MNTRVLGRSGLEISEIGMGCWAIGGPDWNLGMEMGWSGTNDGDALAGLHRALELGATHFDTADVYGHGHSERLLGKMLQNVARNQVVIGTKVGYFHGCASNAYHPLHMRHQLEMSLSNLGTDYIDIYYFHNLYFGENNEYLSDAIAVMHRFKEEGKIRAIGQRGPHQYAPHRGRNKLIDKYEHFLKTASIIQPEVIQVRYNMISPTFDHGDKDIFAWAEANNIGIVINKPLAQGLLLDKYNPAQPPVFGPGDHRLRKRWFKPESLKILQERLTLIKERFGDETKDLVKVALQYCLSRSVLAGVVVGFKTVHQVEMNLSGGGGVLSYEDITFIHEALTGISDEIGSFFSQEVHNE